VCDYDPADYPKDHFRSTPDLNFNELGQLSGSRLTMDKAFCNFARYTGADVCELFCMASLTPARAIGIDGTVGSIEVGKTANLVFMDEKLLLKKVMFEGEII
jgi:N-acetylglucosamine-6-phosphate deacetylase